MSDLRPVDPGVFSARVGDIPPLPAPNARLEDAEAKVLDVLQDGSAKRTSTISAAVGDPRSAALALRRLESAGRVRRLRTGIWQSAAHAPAEEIPPPDHRVARSKDLPALLDEPKTLQRLCADTGLPPKRLESMLSKLQARGLVKAAFDGKVRRWTRPRAEASVLGLGEERLLQAFPGSLPTDADLLAEALGWSPRTTREALDALVEGGFAERADFPARAAFKKSAKGRALSAVGSEPAPPTAAERLLKASDRALLEALRGSSGLRPAAIRARVASRLGESFAATVLSGSDAPHVRLHALTRQGLLRRSSVSYKAHYALSPRARSLLAWLDAAEAPAPVRRPGLLGSLSLSF